MRTLRSMLQMLPAWLLLGGAAVAVEAGTPTTPADADAGHRAHGATPSAAPMPGGSLYRLPVHLQAAGGEHLMLGRYRGEPLVITMFYGTCKSACPLLTRAMTATAAGLPAGARDKVRFLMVSLDPERDTADELQRFTRVHRLQAPAFQVARLDADGVRLLAAALGIRYRRLPHGNFSHSSVLTVLDADGVPQARSERLAGRDAAFSDAIVRLVR